LEAAEWLRVEGQAKIRSGAKGKQLTILEGASLEAGDLLSFETGEVDGELRCETISVASMLRVGPRGRVVAQKIVFGELTVEVGGRFSGYGEVKAKSVEARQEPPTEKKISETSKSK
jgi:cytoskeletal protein CcmA (bactofilin family)